MYCATSRKVAGSISDGVNKIFHLLNPADRTMTLRSIQLLIEMSTREDNGWPERKADNLTTFMCQLCTNSGKLNFLEPYGTFQACKGQKKKNVTK
jgi:hypothetical protein